MDINDPEKPPDTKKMHEDMLAKFNWFPMPSRPFDKPRGKSAGSKQRGQISRRNSGKGKGKKKRLFGA